ncbi:hypothetical protein U1Q18_014195 [Sarracenia purpurea var. burkii]
MARSLHIEVEAVKSQEEGLIDLIQPNWVTYFSNDPIDTSIGISPKAKLQTYDNRMGYQIKDNIEIAKEIDFILGRALHQNSKWATLKATFGYNILHTEPIVFGVPLSI